MGGTKHSWLMREFGAANVICMDMQMSVWNITKTNSVARNIATEMFKSPPWQWGAKSARGSLEGCLSVWEQEIQKNPRQGIVVGSSWGGAVATLALARGIWRGPTILLAPAYGRVAQVANFEGEEVSAQSIYKTIRESVTAEEKSRMVIVHGTDDDVVDIVHSRRMAQATGIRLLEVERGDHRLYSFICAAGSDKHQELPLLRRLIDSFNTSTY